MHYEINVSKNGSHLFATAERSLTTETSLKVVHEKLTEAFPEDEGYNISVTQWHAPQGQGINMEELG